MARPARRQSLGASAANAVLTELRGTAGEQALAVPCKLSATPFSLTSVASRNRSSPF